MKEILVVYFSLGGHTRRVAQRIAHLADADCEAIREVRPRRGWLGYLRSVREALWGSTPAIEPSANEPRDYALVVLGAPVWAENICAPARSYLSRHAGELRQVALFCTQGGPDAARVLKEMSALCGREPVATASFRDAEVDSGQFLASADAFASLLRTRILREA